MSGAIGERQHLANDLYAAAHGALSLKDAEYCQLSANLVEKINSLTSQIKVKEAIKKGGELPGLHAEKKSTIEDNEELEKVFRQNRGDMGKLENWRKVYNASHGPIGAIASTESGIAGKQYWYQPHMNEKGECCQYQVLQRKVQGPHEEPTIKSYDIFGIFFTYNEETSVNDWAEKVKLLRKLAALEAAKKAIAYDAGSDSEGPPEDIRRIEIEKLNELINQGYLAEGASVQFLSLQITDGDRT